MTKKQTKATCIECRHFDIDTRKCSIPSGLMNPVGELSESMAEATHGCAEFEEVRYRVTPMGLLDLALKDNKVKLSVSKLKAVWKSFEESMEKCGYVQTEEQ